MVLVQVIHCDLVKKIKELKKQAQYLIDHRKSVQRNFEKWLDWKWLRFKMKYPDPFKNWRPIWWATKATIMRNLKTKLVMMIIRKIIKQIQKNNRRK